MKIPAASKRTKARIEIIPLIDIMFFLLATFVLVSFSMVENRGLIVDLPSSSTSDQQSKMDTQKNQLGVTHINVLRTGEILIDKSPVEEVNIEETLREKIKANDSGQLQIRIQADKLSPLEKTVAVMDTARKLGIGDVLLHTVAKP